MTAGRVLAGVAIASLLVTPACRRRSKFALPPESGHVYELSFGRDDGRDAGGAAPAPRPPPARHDNPAEEPLLTQKALSPELRKLVDEAHAHPAVASLEAAGCDLVLVMTGAKYDRFVDVQHEQKKPAPSEDPRQLVVWCQRRTPTPPDCAELAPIFARVARPKRPFQVFSGYVDPPFAPRCAGLHDKNGKFRSGEGPGYHPPR